MTSFYLFLCLLFIASCGKSSSNSSTKANQGFTQEEIKRCGYEDSRIVALCIPLSDYVVHSQKTLPAKIKLTLTVGDFKAEFIDECKQKENDEVTRAETSGLIAFSAQRKVFDKGAHLEIIDLGGNCRNDAIFYSAFITPDVQLNPKARDVVVFDLEN